MVAPEVISHWRDSGRIPRFFGIDARSTFPLLLFLMHIKVWTFIVAVVATIVFGLIERYGFSAIVFVRIIRSLLAGRRKLVKPWWREDKKL
ncbi:MAG: IcmT/TraK family protein [Gammaproteobacteria bacterium]